MVEWKRGADRTTFESEKDRESVDTVSPAPNMLGSGSEFIITVDSESSVG